MLAVEDFIATKELEYHHVFASMHSISVSAVRALISSSLHPAHVHPHYSPILTVPSHTHRAHPCRWQYLEGLLSGVSRHCRRRLQAGLAAAVGTSPGGDGGQRSATNSLALDFLLLQRRLLSTLRLAQRSGHVDRRLMYAYAFQDEHSSHLVALPLWPRMRAVLASCRDTFEALEGGMRSLMAEATADAMQSESQRRYLTFLSRLASYSDGLLEEAQAIQQLLRGPGLSKRVQIFFNPSALPNADPCA